MSIAGRRRSARRPALAGRSWRRAPGGVGVPPSRAGCALLRAIYRYAIRACCVAADDGRLVAGLPLATVSSRLTGRRLVALPFSDLCPPLSPATRPADGHAALAEALEALGAAPASRWRSAGPATARGGAGRASASITTCCALEPDVAGGRAPVREGRRSLRGVRRARREGLHRRVPHGPAGALAAFYRLHVATRRRLGRPDAAAPVHPRPSRRCSPRASASSLLVRRGDRPSPRRSSSPSATTLLYKYGASDARDAAARARTTSCSWRRSAGAASTACARLDFGRTHWDHESLRAFKLAWGAEERELRYRDVGGGAPRRRAAAGRAAAGAPSIRRSPPLAGRVIGEVLYRHAG